MRPHTSILLAGALALSLGGAGVIRAATSQQPTPPTAPATYTVIAGWGDSAQVANAFTPSVREIYAGDTVTWTIGGSEEPHTVTFGPPALIEQLAASTTMVMMQHAGPPMIVFNPKVAFPTPSPTYAGMGLANSGLLQGKGKSWSLTFTVPGTYHYYCLLHHTAGAGDGNMQGEVIVHARPTAGHMIIVSMGSKYEAPNSALDGFFPRHLTVHVGDTVAWCCGFHTVTFGPEATIQQLEKSLIVPMPQKSGPPMLTVNPKIFFPSGGHTYNGTGFLNSGILVGPQAKPFAITFTKAGTYGYDCLVHNGMDGTVTVLPVGM